MVGIQLASSRVRQDRFVTPERVAHPVPPDGGTVLKHEIFGPSFDDDLYGERDLSARA
jgi:hypothetical protein